MFIGIVKMIFQMSLISSGVILIVLFFRWIMGKMKVAASFKCLLWAVVLFRLICPYALTSSIAFIPEKLYSMEFSAGNVSESFSENNAENTSQNLSQAKVENESQSGLKKVSEDKTDTDYSSSYIMTDSSPKQSFLETIASIDIWLWICIIWSLGFAGMIVWEIASYIGLKRKLVGSLTVACGTNSVANIENDSSEATNTKVNTQNSQTESVNEEANVDTTETAKDEVAKENDNAVGDEADIIYNENGLLGAISNGDWTIALEQYEEDLKDITGGLFGEAEGDDYEVTLTVVDKDKKEVLSSKILSVDKNIENKKMAETFLYEHNGKQYFATYCLAYSEEISAGYCVGHVENEKIIWDVIIYDPGNADGTTVYDCTETGSISDYSKKGKVLYETKTAGKVDEQAYLKAISDKLKNVGIDLEEAQFTNYSHKYYKMKLQNTNPSAQLDI